MQLHATAGAGPMKTGLDDAGNGIRGDHWAARATAAAVPQRRNLAFGYMRLSGPGPVAALHAGAHHCELAGPAWRALHRLPS